MRLKKGSRISEGSEGKAMDHSVNAASHAENIFLPLRIDFHQYVGYRMSRSIEMSSKEPYENEAELQTEKSMLLH